MGGARRAFRLAGSLGVLLLAGCLWNLHDLLRYDRPRVVVPGGVYRSAQLEPAALALEADALALSSVLNLRGQKPESAWYREERRVLEQQGVALHDLRLSAGRLPSRQELKRLLQLIRTAPRPVLIHCRGGSERTGLAAALVLLLQGADLEEARRQLALFPIARLDPTPSELGEVMHQYQSWLRSGARSHTPEQLERFVASAYTSGIYAAHIEALELRPRVKPGVETPLRFRVENRSPRAWRLRPVGTPRGIHLGLWLRAEDGSLELELRGETPDRLLAPGESTDLAALLPPLHEPGLYHITVDLVDETVAWFADRGSRPLELGLRVEASSGVARAASALELETLDTPAGGL
jgi:protein tyrosine/serine phosphatase